MALGIANSPVTIKICVITAGIKKYHSIIQKKKQKHDKIATTNLNTLEVLISNSLIDSNISHYEFASLNNKLEFMMI